MTSNQTEQNRGPLASDYPNNHVTTLGRREPDLECEQGRAKTQPFGDLKHMSGSWLGNHCASE